MASFERVPTRASSQKTENELQVVVHESRKRKHVPAGLGEETDISTRSSDKSEVKPVSLKSAKFEVMKFAMSSYKAREKGDAKVALAIQLGARPPKNKYLNYKLLKEQKLKEKAEIENSEKMQTIGKILKKTGRPVHHGGKARGSKSILGQYGKVSKGMVAKVSKGNKSSGNKKKKR